MENPDVRLLTNDASLESLVSILCDEAGISVGRSPSTRIPLILDLDTCDVPSDRKYSCIIGISRNPDTLPDKLVHRCRRVITRPFGFRELIFALRDAIENATTETFELKKSSHPALKLGKGDHTATCGRSRVNLTPNEFLILKSLLEAAGRTVGYCELNRLIGNEPDSGALVVHICSLRKKLTGLCGKPLIATVRGEGYKI